MFVYSFIFSSFAFLSNLCLRIYSVLLVVDTFTKIKLYNIIQQWSSKTFYISIWKVNLHLALYANTKTGTLIFFSSVGNECKLQNFSKEGRKQAYINEINLRTNF